MPASSPAQSSPAARTTAQCEVVLFHSVLGVRAAITEWADRLREAGHVVHVADLYEGEVFDDYPEGFAHVEKIGGIETLIERSHAAVASLPADVVYMGFSNGAASAELLAATRPGARGAVLLHGAIPLEAFGLEAGWPSSVPAQLHYAAADPFHVPEEDAAFVAGVRASGAALDVFEYEANGHLFADAGMPEFHAASADLMLARVVEFLGRVGQQ